MVGAVGEQPQHQPVLRRVVSELDRAQWLAQSRATTSPPIWPCRTAAVRHPADCDRPPYTDGRAGISDHNYVTKVFGDGTFNTDVGPNFRGMCSRYPVAFWANPVAPATPPAPAPAPAPKPIPRPCRHQHRRRFPPRRPAPNWVAGLPRRPTLPGPGLHPRRDGDTRHAWSSHRSRQSIRLPATVRRQREG